MPDKAEQSSFLNVNPDGEVTVRPGGKSPELPQSKRKKSGEKPEKTEAGPEGRWAWTNQDKPEKPS
jgi:hypothetical protein